MWTEAVEEPTAEEGTDCWRLPLCYAFLLLLWGMLFWALVTCENVRVKPQLHGVVLWSGLALLLVPLVVLLVKVRAKDGGGL